MAILRSALTCLLCDFAIKIMPGRIKAFNQTIFSFSIPGLYLFFSFDSRSDIGCFFVIYKPVNTIFGSEAVRVLFVSVFMHPADQVVRDAGV